MEEEKKSTFRAFASRAKNQLQKDSADFRLKKITFKLKNLQFLIK